jgi:hypothetical protein
MCQKRKSNTPKQNTSEGTISKWLDHSSVNPDLPLVYTPANVDMLKMELEKKPKWKVCQLLV